MSAVACCYMLRFLRFLICSCFLGYVTNSYHRKKEIDFMKDIATGKHIHYLLHMSWTTNKANKLLFLKQMGLWYTSEACESGGAVDLAKDSSGTSLQQKCCSAEALISCHYRDKPSTHACHGQGKNIDVKGQPFW